MKLRRPLWIVASLGLVVTISPVMTSANAVPPTTSATQDGPVLSGASFFTSFESGQPQPGYTDTVETGPDGTPRTGGVQGPDADRRRRQRDGQGHHDHRER